ncbi:MAG: hypothetical protein KAJ28_12260 [Flavobacteriaceae bacterium]|nr:hypothetical protein [Flavobacteriaceae bacterium]
MKAKVFTILCLLIVTGIVFVGCNNKNSTKDKPENSAIEAQAMEDETKTENRTTIDPTLDPLVVGKEFSKVFGDTLNIQMYELTLKPGDSMGLHEHLDHTVYVLEGGKLLVYFNGTDPVEMELAKGMGFVSGPITDTAVNVGETNITLLMNEILRPRE